jgi:hypothetical protein
LSGADQVARVGRVEQQRAILSDELRVRRKCGDSYTNWQPSAAWASKIAVYQHQGQDDGNQRNPVGICRWNRQNHAPARITISTAMATSNSHIVAR